MKSILFAIGTRPEAIKIAPVIWALHDLPVRCVVILTAQHRELTDQMLPLLGVAVDEDLDLMREEQALPGLTGRVITEMSGVLERWSPNLVVVQGDTTTVLGSALAAFYQKIPVAHLEAGLRTGAMYNPFPEEMNRALVGRLATIHLCPTIRARDNLLREGCPSDALHVTGNTVVDALTRIRSKLSRPAGNERGLRTVLVTLHRREHHGAPLERFCRAIARIPAALPYVRVLYPVHPNPVVRRAVGALLGDAPGVDLVPPASYVDFLSMLAHCDLVLTDSGGVQEEAPSFGKPVLVLRENTERPEAIEAGVAKLVGTESNAILDEAVTLLSNTDAYASMVGQRNPFGDGHAAQRVTRILLGFLDTRPMVPPSPHPL